MEREHDPNMSSSDQRRHHFLLSFCIIISLETNLHLVCYDFKVVGGRL